MNRKILISLGGLCSLLLWTESSFADCYINRSNFKAQNVTMDMGEVTINPSTPIGILKTGSFTINGQNGLTACNGNGGSSIGKILIGHEIPKNAALSAAVPDGEIYSTNVPGIGVRLYRDSGDVKAYYPHILYLNRSNSVNLRAGIFKVDIIKTSDEVGTGSLSSGLYSTYYNNGDGETKPILTSTLNANGIMIKNSTCEITGNANQTVNMGTIQRSKLNNVGDVDDITQPVQIDVKCNGGNDKTQTVKIGFDYTPDSAHANNGVIANAITGSSGSVYAKGIGIQLLTNDLDRVVKTGDKVSVGETQLNNETTEVVKLRARYYKTAIETTPGDVSAVVNFNLVYQ